MDGDGVAVGGSGGSRELFTSYEGELDDGGGRKVTYIGGWMKCIVLKEDMGLEEMRRKMSEITINDLTVQKLWYSLKYDRGMIMDFEGNGDMRMFLKGNDEHGYLYIGKSDGPKRRTQNGTRTCNDGVVHRKSSMKRDDMVEEGCKGVGVKRASVSESGRCIHNHPQIRLRVGWEIIEMSNDDKISVASKDMGDDEAATEGGEENSKGKGVMKGATLMRACGHGRVRKRKATTLGKKMDKHKQDMMKWKNGVGERIKQKLANTSQKMGCIAAVECYSLMLGKYSVELTNSHKLVVKLGQQTCTCRQTRGIPCCHALTVIAKANLWVYDYLHPIYKIAIQQIMYNQLVHPMETHDMGIVDAKTGRVVSGDELDNDYNHCILPPLMGDNHLDTRGALVAIPVPTLMPTMKAMLWRLKIY
ncbi:LOW QUALITY PROTEIN: hypothetical protein Cgig2_012562 [Carnegiea gigantea]|uniref:SWIM-type domain-containing protein n=1 Tax=Carnegiea gigantea TaxID=171969 RepID=A0A9Q1K2U9_9CARY|nr:LOW QUALITY PROTEIN: hypothetical protein Cgig2_012562 [Carnegiea gigantea]